MNKFFSLFRSSHDYTDNFKSAVRNAFDTIVWSFPMEALAHDLKNPDERYRLQASIAHTMMVRNFTSFSHRATNALIESLPTQSQNFIKRTQSVPQEAVDSAADSLVKVYANEGWKWRRTADDSSIRRIRERYHSFSDAYLECFRDHRQKGAAVPEAIRNAQDSTRQLIRSTFG